MAMAESTKTGKRMSGCDSLPVSQSGRCHDPQSGPRMSAAVSALRLSCRCGRANPRQPSSSPSALPGKIEKMNMTRMPIREESTGRGTAAEQDAHAERKGNQQRQDQYHRVTKEVRRAT